MKLIFHYRKLLFHENGFKFSLQAKLSVVHQLLNDVIDDFKKNILKGFEMSHASTMEYIRIPPSLINYVCIDKRILSFFLPEIHVYIVNVSEDCRNSLILRNVGQTLIVSISLPLTKKGNRIL